MIIRLMYKMVVLTQRLHLLQNYAHYITRYDFRQKTMPQIVFTAFEQKMYCTHMTSEIFFRYKIYIQQI